MGDWAVGTVLIFLEEDLPLRRLAFDTNADAACSEGKAGPVTG